MSSKSLYETLGVDKSASTEEIRKAFRKLALVHHPDKGGDEEKFKEIVRANEILTDETKRSIYDQTGQIPGEDGVPGPGFNPFGGGGPGGPPGFHFDIGNLFGMFGQGGPGRNVRRGGKAPSQTQHVPLELKHFYFGYSIGININRQIICKTCDGSGAKKKEACTTCKGVGVQTQIINMGGMTMHSQGPCVACQGKGSRTIEECTACHSTGRKSEAKSLEGKVVPGMKGGDTIIFTEACSEQKEYERAGDIVIILVDAQNGNWKRTGSDGQHLETNVKINMSESLVGCVVRLNGHPAYDDGLYIQIPAGSFNGDTYCVSGLGMPIKDKTDVYGDLYINISVEVSAEERKLLATKAQEVLLPLFGEKVRAKPAADTEIETKVQLKA
jgi:DnaJ family protein A protein 2